MTPSGIWPRPRTSERTATDTEPLRDAGEAGDGVPASIPIVAGLIGAILAARRFGRDGVSR